MILPTSSGIAPALPSGWRLIIRLFVPLSLGYFLSYFFRTINAVIVPQLTGDFGLTASTIGLLTSVYFLAFAGMQIPIGLLVDRFGPRKVQTVLLLVQKPWGLSVLHLGAHFRN